MAGNIYLYLDGIPGESTSHVFTGWIDVMSFSLGATMEIDQDARTGSGGGTSGAADPEDLSFETKMSLSTVVLLQACAVGAVIPRGRLIQCNVVNQKLLAVSDYAIGDSIISSVSVNASGGDIPSESFSINYGSIIWRYHCYNHYRPDQHLKTIEREWSLVSSNPKKADPNTYDAVKIARTNVFDPDPDDGDKFSYDSFGSNVKVSFKPGQPVIMEQKEDTSS